MTCPVCQSELYRNDNHFLIDGGVWLCMNVECVQYLHVVKNLPIDTGDGICYNAGNGGTK